MLLILMSFMAAACAIGLASRQDRVKAYWLRRAIAQHPHFDPLKITYPFDDAVFPPEIVAPVFRWSEPESSAHEWLVTVRFDKSPVQFDHFVRTPTCRPSPQQWEVIKRHSVDGRAVISVVGQGARDGTKVFFQGTVALSTSKDPLRDSIFYREVILPFSDAVKDPSRIRWRFGSVANDSAPPVVLENLPVCGNCHSFSADGKVLGMDVDYGNDKGAYALTRVAKEMTLATSDIITWSDYKRDPEKPTFGLLSQVSPDGRFVVSTVKDRSVFVARPDLAFSQLFFPVQGILAVYDSTTKAFSSLPGADDDAFVQSNPAWSPDGKFIVFARHRAHHLQNLRDKQKALLTPEDCREFVDGHTLFKFDLYRIPFDGGKGGVAEPLAGASENGRSNYFARFSPDGRWIVFCQANSFMLLQPDSKLYILPADGGEARPLRCNTARMNSWHSWSSNSRWLVFSSKANSPYTQLFVTHIDENGVDAPAVLLEHLTAPDRAANIPELVAVEPDAIARISAIARANGAQVREAKSETERAKLWTGRKAAFAAMGRLAPDMLCMDGTIPRRALPAVLARMDEMAKEFDLGFCNVFHAGDGNLHPLITFDVMKDGELARAEAFGAAILRLCVEVGGVLSGEHGIGVEKAALMPTMFLQSVARRCTVSTAISTPQRPGML